MMAVAQTLEGRLDDSPQKDRTIYHPHEVPITTPISVGK